MLIGMEKERITKDDGRYLIYYRFGDEENRATKDKANLGKNAGSPCDGCCGTSPSLDTNEGGKGRKACQN
ncbi:MAG: hypothetical protein GX354_07285 [Firmicutes bacterium]|jgi:hypothetical protein|nr:hypothetical protein [Bacillota bacterium]